MRIQITPEELQACAQRFQLASGRLQEVAATLRYSLDGVDMETRQTVNIEGFIGAALSKANAITEVSNAIAGFLNHKAAAFATVDAHGGKEISAEAQALIDAPAPRPDWAVWQAAEAKVKAFLAPGALLRDPEEGDGWSFSRMVRVAWNATKEFVADALENPWVAGALDVVSAAAGVFAVTEGWAIAAAGVALLATGPIGIIIGAGALVLGGVMMVHGAGDFVEGTSGVISRVLGRRDQYKLNPVEWTYKRILGDTAGERAFNIVSVATLVPAAISAGSRILSTATSRTAAKAAGPATGAAREAAKQAGRTAAKEATERIPYPTGGRGVPKRVQRAIGNQRENLVRSARDSAGKAARRKVLDERTFNPRKYQWQRVEQAREKLGGPVDVINGGKDIWDLGGTYGLVPKPNAT